MAKNIGTEACGRENRMDYLRRQLIAAAKQCGTCRGTGFTGAYFAGAMHFYDPQARTWRETREFPTWHAANAASGRAGVATAMRLCRCQLGVRRANGVADDDFSWSRDDSKG